MLARLYLVYLLSFFASISFANEANWNCQQDKSTKEWVCVGSAGSAAKSMPNTQDKPDTVEQGNLAKPTTNAPVPVAPPKNSEPRAVEALKNNQLTQPKLDDKPVDSALEEEAAERPDAPRANPIAVRPLNPPDVSEAPPPVLPASQKPNSVIAKEAGVLDEGGNSRPRGWNCDTKGKDGNWNCQLVGADPRGEARVVETEDRGFRLRDPAFDNKQEHIFNTLRDRFKHNPWGNCTIQLGSKKYYISDKKLRAKANVDMNSNAAEIYDNEIGNYQGRVEMQRADQRASSNSANYDSVSEALDLHGNVFYSEDDVSLFTETATLKLASDEARMRDTLFISPETPIRGKASAVYRDSKTLSRYKDVAYTSCEPGNQDWVVHATDLKLNKETSTGSAKNAWIEFKEVPIFYSPYLSFPLDNRRKSGFLAPSFGNTQKAGFHFSAPFYWNIAPDYDAVIRPRYYSTRGGLLAGDFRYLAKKSSGRISAEYMPDDAISHKPRYLATIKNNAQFTPNIKSNLDLNIVSDKEYYSQLGNALSFPVFSNIRSFADASYVDKGISLTGIVENYQTIDPILGGRLTPYRRLPQLNLNLDHSFKSLMTDIGIQNEYVYFQHDDSKLPDAFRFNVKPYVSFPLKTASVYLTPKFSVQYTQYLLNVENSPFKDSNISRTLPIASVDGGLFLEKDVNLFGNSMLHTLEPRLFYLYIPKVNQDNIPIFDTSLYDFNYDSLFRENRYSGTDRIQDANQITAALTTRLIDSKTGLEKLKLNVGEIFYFQNREVTGPIVRAGLDFLNNPVQTSTSSPLVAEMSSQINKHVGVQLGTQWDPHSNEFVRGNAAIHFENNPGELINLGFTYRKNTLLRDSLDLALADNTLTADERARFNLYRNSFVTIRSNDIITSDISMRWPIYDNWYGVGRWQYSWLFNQSQDGFVGLEKETCCWRFRIIGRRYVNNLLAAANNPSNLANPQFNSQTGIFFQIEFKGLTGTGLDLGNFFAKTIYGYRKKGY
jgi:LPS-assembly protein